MTLQTHPSISRQSWKSFLSLFICLLPSIIFGAFCVVKLKIIYDEGLYALLATYHWQGQRAYQDFLFTQTPILLYIYSPILHFFGESIYTARTFSWLFGLLAQALTLLCARRIGGNRAMILCSLLLCFNGNINADLTTMRTQSLTVLFSALLLWLLTFQSWSSSLWAWGCAILLVLTRLSMLPVLLLCYLYLAVLHPQKRVWIPILGLLNGIMYIAMIQYYHADGNLWFGLYEFHQAIFQYQSWSIRDWFQLYALGVIQNQAWLLICCLLATVYFFRQFSPRAWFRRLDSPFHPVLIFCILSWLTTTLIHSTRNFSYPTYQTSNVIFLVLFCSCSLTPLLDFWWPKSKEKHGVTTPKWRRVLHLRKLAVIVFICAGLALTPWQQINLVLGDAGTIEAVKLTVEYIRGFAFERKTLLTWNTELALGTGLKLLPGYELGQFSYFAQMDDRRAAQLKVLNYRQVKEDIEQKKADLIVLANRDFKLLSGTKSAELLQAITDNYIYINYIDHYGQFFDRLEIFQKKQP